LPGSVQQLFHSRDQLPHHRRVGIADRLCFGRFADERRPYLILVQYGPAIGDFGLGQPGNGGERQLTAEVTVGTGSRARGRMGLVVDNENSRSASVAGRASRRDTDMSGATRSRLVCRALR
jgi:hypothetical protein